MKLRTLVLGALLLALSSASFGQGTAVIIRGQVSPGSYENLVTDGAGHLVVNASGQPGVSTFTNTTATVTSSTGQVIAANTSRRYLQIQNNDASGIIYCTPTSAATTTNGVKLTAGQYWAPLIPPNNAINCIGSIASNANVIITEGN